MAATSEGPWAIRVMWILTALTFVFVLLRNYTRVFVVRSFGIDDHVYNFAFILLVAYTASTTVSSHYGFGMNMWDIKNPNNEVKAILYEAIGQTFAVVGMAIAKWSLGLFLLRVINETWQKVAVWVAMISLMGASISTCFVFWLQCSPPAYLWDRRIPGGHCDIDSTPVSMILCILCVIVDFFFAMFPWFFIWKLQMKSREKFVILASLSLGVIAGACGIKRTLEVPELSSPNYLRDTVGLIVWSAAEIAVTMICISIGVCRPLYKTALQKIFSSYSEGKYQQGSGPNLFAMRTFGGSTMKPRPREYAECADSIGDGDNASYNVIERKTGIKGPFTKTYATGGGNDPPENSSDEEILGENFRRTQQNTGPEHGIVVTEQYTVSRA